MHDRIRSAASDATLPPRLPRARMTNLELFDLEWRRLRRDGVFWIAVALGCLALWFGLANGAAWMRFQQQAILRAGAIAEESLVKAKAEAKHLDEIGKEIGTFDDPRSAVGFESHFLRLHDCLIPTPLAMVAVGQSDLLPYCSRVGVGPLAFFAANHEWENPLRLLLGRFDSAFAIIYLLPLLVLATSFDLLSREEELNTLPLIRSCPVPISRWLAACFLLRGLVFVGLALAAMILGMIAAGFDASAPGAILRLSLLLTMTTAYLGFWFAAAWLVNARGGSSASHSLVLASLWLVLVVLAPAGLNLLVKSLYPLPSRVAFVDAVRQAADASAREATALLADYFHDHPDLARGATRRAEFGSRRLAVDMATEAAVQGEKDRFRSLNESQQALVDGLRFVSPAILFQQAGNALAGNDPSRHKSFMEAVEVHRARLRDFFAPAFVSDAAFTGFDQVPAFTYRDESIGAAAEEASIGLVVLLLAIALLVAAGTVALRRLSSEQ